jgi:hypothetical protein
VVTGGGDASIVLWNVEPLASITRDPRPIACVAAAGAFSPPEWARWVSPDVPYENNC